jgi:5-methylcytosine-specific restriction enzyme subunit McrC
MSREALQVFEHQRLTIGKVYRTNQGSEVIFSAAHFDALARYADRHPHPPYELRHRGVVFRQFVGVIQVGTLTIEILPKADRNLPSVADDKRRWRSALLQMLQLCPNFRVRELARAELQTEDADLLSLYIGRFLDEVERLLREGLVRSYRTLEENRTSFRGRILFAENLRENFAHAERVYVATHELNVDRIENQLLLRALRTLTKLRLHISLADRAHFLVAQFPSVRNRDITVEDFARLAPTRQSQRYAESLTLARMILLHHSPAPRPGAEDMLALLLDMNLLFQNFVLAVLRQTAPPGLTVQGGAQRDFWPEGERSPKRLLPDILVRQEDRSVLVIDTKWKPTDGGWPSDQDLRQIFAYGEYFGAPSTVLLYPASFHRSTSSTGRFIERNLASSVHYVDLSPGPVHQGKLDVQAIGVRLWAEMLPPHRQNG